MKNRIYEDLTKCIGKTPLLSLDKLEKKLAGRIAAKMESCNLTGSVKDRTALFKIGRAHV
jgi:cysteine synthase